jgi:hypothetical protein
VGAIEPKLRDDVPFSLGTIFPVRQSFAGFDAAIEERFRSCIHGVEIEVAGHVWRNSDAVGSASLIEEKRVGDGLFYNIDGSFVVTCPICEYSRLFGEGDGEYVHDSFNAWCASPYQATMRCPVCESASPLRDWRSSNQTFAAGYLTALFEKPTPPAGEYLRRLVGDVSDSWIPVFCHI